MSLESQRGEWRRYVIECWSDNIQLCRCRDRVYLWRQGRYGPPTDAAEVPIRPGDYAGTLAAVRTAVGEMVKRPNKPSEGSAPVGAVCDPVTQQRHPVLWEYLTATRYDDGSAREPSTLLVFMQDGMLKGMVRDKDGDRCLWVACRSLVGLIEALNESLADDQADWRPDRKAPGQQASRGKRAG